MPSGGRVTSEVASPDGGGADDLDARIAGVTSNYSDPPSADELRRAFTTRREQAPPEAEKSDFATRFPTETLFTQTVAPAPDTATIDSDRDRAEDRSRTRGDYYYDPDDAWGVLGVPPGCSWSEIAAAHRQLAMRHHPDRLLGASAAERAESEARMREVNVAYSVLRRLTGH